jgi:hypothetical protein
MPGLENTPLRTNIVIHISYKSLVYFVKQKQFQNMFLQIKSFVYGRIRTRNL